MELAYGIIPKKYLHLPYDQFLVAIENSIAEFSYSPNFKSDFLGFFKFLIAYYEDCDDIDILRKLVDSLSSIAGYKLGISVGEVFALAEKIVLKLLSSTNVNNLKSAVDYFRKVSRVIGPRAVIQDFSIPIIDKEQCHRGLAIIAHQSIADNPKFKFNKADFGRWVNVLAGVIGIGPRLINAIKQVFPSLEGFDNVQTGRPPSVPVKFNLTQMKQMEPVGRPPLPHPNSARPTVPKRLFPRKETMTNSKEPPSIMYKLTGRQQQIREFVDQPFGEDDPPINEYFQQCKAGIQDTDWEERSASYNQFKRILRYANDILMDDDYHLLVTCVMDDVSSQRAALALSSIGALVEAFVQNPQTMTLELGRILPIILKLHQKTAQFFEEALNGCFQTIIDSIPPKRFIALIVANSETKSVKVQVATSNYIEMSLHKALKIGDTLFPKKSNEIRALVKLLNKLLNAPVAEAREPAKQSIHYIRQIYGNSLHAIVENALEPQDSLEFNKIY